MVIFSFMPLTRTLYALSSSNAVFFFIYKDRIQSPGPAPDASTSVWREFNKIIDFFILICAPWAVLGFISVAESSSRAEAQRAEEMNTLFLHIMFWIIQNSVCTRWTLGPSISDAFASLPEEALMISETLLDHCSTKTCNYNRKNNL